MGFSSNFPALIFMSMAKFRNVNKLQLSDTGIV